MKKPYAACPYLVFCLLLVACNGGDSHWDGPRPTNDGPSLVTSRIGPAGGVLSLRGALLEVPAGALAEETEITVGIDDTQPPSFLRTFTPVYRISPEGLRFDKPATFRFLLRGDSAAATVFVQSTAGAVYDPVETTVRRDVAAGRINVLSGLGLAGSACTGASCCDQANGKLDLLMVVDNSESFGEEQERFVREVPRLFRGLATGDLDGDGTQDSSTFGSIHVGIVSTDMGTGPYTMTESCQTENGGDGLLVSRADSTIPGCQAEYGPPPYIRFGDEGVSSADEFAQSVGCVARLGDQGCGIEQPLEATLKALTPSTSDLRFYNGSLGHGDTIHAGFLRHDALLMVLVLTDEDDCSAKDIPLFDPDNDEYGGTATWSVRCQRNPSALHNIARYVDGLLALRDDPRDVLFSVIGGIPPAFPPDEVPLNFDALLSDPLMQYRDEPVPGSLGPRYRAIPSCVTSTGQAYPPRRLVEVARAFGERGVVSSICKDSFQDHVRMMVDRIGRRGRGECL